MNGKGCTGKGLPSRVVFSSFFSGSCFPIGSGNGKCNVLGPLSYPSMGLLVFEFLEVTTQPNGYLTFYFPWYFQHLGCPTLSFSINFARFDG